MVLLNSCAAKLYLNQKFNLAALINITITVSEFDPEPYDLLECEYPSKCILFFKLKGISRLWI